MARGINKVILIGNLGSDPEVRSMNNGNPVATFSLATSESWKDKVSGEKQERTEWHRVACFNKLAEIVGEYVKKGSKLYVEGSLRTRKWQDQEGKDRYTTEIVAADIQMLDSRGGNTNAGFGYEDLAPMSESTAQAYQSSTRQEKGNAPSLEVFNELNDDIPF